MPVNIDILDFKCFNVLKNGPNFDQNTGDFTTNLVGNVGEKVKVEFYAYVSQFASAENGNEWNLTGAPTNEIRRSSGSFLDDEIQIGDYFNFFDNWEERKEPPITIDFAGTVTFISSDGLTLQYTPVISAPTNTGNLTNVGMSFDQGVLNNINRALFLKFGLLENEETFNYLSKTSESQQVYYVGELQNDTRKEMESLGNVKDWVSGKAYATRVLAPPFEIFGADAFFIEHEFVINPFYILAYREFIESSVTPDIFSGDNALKYAFEIEFRKSLTNTGSSKPKSFSDLLGFVGWYGENLNGLNPDYEILSISYEDEGSGVPLDGVNISLTTKATIVISKIGGTITDFSVGAYLIKIPESEEEYIGTDTDIMYNYMYRSSATSSDGHIPPSGFLNTSLVGGDLILEYDITFSVDERLRLSTDNEYLLLVQMEDPSISAGDSDRIMLIADFRNYVDLDFLSLFVNVDEYLFLQHTQNLNSNEGISSLVTSNEDGILLNAAIATDTSRDVVINSVVASLLAYDSVNNKSFELDRYDFNIGEAIISGGVQQIEVDTTRGYPLPSGDDFNLVKISTGAQQGDFRQYSIQIGQKVKWQDWIFNPSVDSVFFNSSQPNNNLNLKSSNYSDLEGYEIYFALIINVTGKDDLGRTLTGDYVHYGSSISVNDYDESDGSVTGVIQTFDLDTGNSLQGNILYNGKDTLFRSVFQNAAAMQYAIHRIEPSQNQGDGILELSSQVVSVPNNLLKPIAGESQLTFDLVGSTLTTECLIDGSLIQEGVSYKLSARTSFIPVPPFSFGNDFIFDGVNDRGERTGVNKPLGDSWTLEIWYKWKDISATEVVFNTNKVSGTPPEDTFGLAHNILDNQSAVRFRDPSGDAQDISILPDVGLPSNEADYTPNANDRVCVIISQYLDGSDYKIRTFFGNLDQNNDPAFPPVDGGNKAVLTNGSNLDTDSQTLGEGSHDGSKVSKIEQIQFGCFTQNNTAYADFANVGIGLARFYEAEFSLSDMYQAFNNGDGAERRSDKNAYFEYLFNEIINTNQIEDEIGSNNISLINTNLGASLEPW